MIKSVKQHGLKHIRWQSACIHCHTCCDLAAQARVVRVVRSHRRTRPFVTEPAESAPSLPATTMRTSAFLTLLAAPAALATPALLQDVVDGITGLTDLSGGIFGGVAKAVEHLVHDIEDVVEKKVQWSDQLHSKPIVSNGLSCKHTHPAAIMSSSLIRVLQMNKCPIHCSVTISCVSPSRSSVTRASSSTAVILILLAASTCFSGTGALTPPSPHSILTHSCRFFESRTAPEDAPLVLWLNGGPGCSSSTGLLFELGPCNIAQEGTNTTHNKYGWNSHANIIFLDQPVNVGFSYSDDGSTVNTSPAAGEDVYAFLELFLTRFPKYAKAPFHLAAESYGGTYAPNIAAVIHRENIAQGVTPTPGIQKINLASVVLANGLTDPFVQFASVPDYMCDGPFPVFDTDSAECQSLRSKVPTCQRLIKACYDYNSRFTCVPAALYCNSQFFGPLQRKYLF